ncbi:MAG: hypothetical protein J6M47_09880 [Clostridia bacterium]|nr:hypothetical protein [Clostridia bacterium]
MNNVTLAEVSAAQKKAIAQMLNVVDDPTTIHKVWAILNNRYSQQQKEGRTTA